MLSKSAQSVISITLATIMSITLSTPIFAAEQDRTPSETQLIGESAQIIEQNPSLNSSYQNYFSTEHTWIDGESAEFAILNNKILNSNGEVLFEADGKITEFFTNSELIYFRVNNTIYRLHIDSNIVDEI